MLLSDRGLTWLHGSSMFERFTDRARRLVVLAQDAARDIGHARIRPEHLLVGLQQGEGLAADAMTESGLDGAALRRRVSVLYESAKSAKKVDKVPFSSETKRCLEQSLRAATALGHNYIGTEHLFFGVRRHSEMNNQPVDEVLGVDVTQIQRRLIEMLGGTSPMLRSPGLQSALEQARAEAGESSMTTGHVMAAMLADPNSQVSRAFIELGIDPQRAQSAVDGVNLAENTDGRSAPKSLAVVIGESTTVIADPEVASALQHLSPEQLQELLRRAVAQPDTNQRLA